MNNAGKDVIALITPNGQRYKICHQIGKRKYITFRSDIEDKNEQQGLLGQCPLHRSPEMNHASEMYTQPDTSLSSNRILVVFRQNTLRQRTHVIAQPKNVSNPRHYASWCGYHIKFA